MRLITEKESAELFDDMGPSTQISGGSGANTAVGHRLLRRQGRPFSAR